MTGYTIGVATFRGGYWYCPRCRGKDLYRAPRQVGSVGLGRFFDGLDSNPDLESIGFGQRAIEKMVWLCRSCGERAVHMPKVKVLTKEERERLDSRFGILLTFITALSGFFAWVFREESGMLFGAISISLITGLLGFMQLGKNFFYFGFWAIAWVITSIKLFNSFIE
jgi:hypothetical protein